MNGKMMQLQTKNKNLKFVIYVRCSTDEQSLGTYTTLDAQAHHCKNILNAFGYELADFGKNGIVEDDGYSGKNLKRPGIQSILNDIQTKRSFDGVVFFRLDRLTRSSSDLHALMDLFMTNDFAFLSVKEKLDGSTAFGRAGIGMMGVFAAFERELISERVKASLSARVSQGLPIGGRTRIGYKLIKDGEPLSNGRQPMKVIKDDSVASHIKVVFEMTADNRSLTAIGQELLRRGIKTANGKIWRRQAIATIIRSPFYKGYIPFHGECYKGKHEPIVSEQLWEKANKVLSAKLPGHSYIKQDHGDAYLLSGLLKCGGCESHMVNAHSAGRDKGQKFYYYECSRSRQGLGCSCKRISAPALNEAIVKYFQHASKDQSIIVSAIGNAILESQQQCDVLDEKLMIKQKALDSLRHNADKLLQLAMNDIIPAGATYKKKLAAIEAEIEDLAEETQKLQTQKRVAQMNAASGEFLHSNIRLIMQHLDRAPHEAKKNLLQALIKDMIIYDDKIAINMILDESLIAPLPAFADQVLQNEKNPTPTIGQDEVLVSTPSVSQGRLIWGG